MSVTSLDAKYPSDIMLSGIIEIPALERAIIHSGGAMVAMTIVTTTNKPVECPDIDIVRYRGMASGFRVGLTGSPSPSRCPTWVTLTSVITRDPASSRELGVRWHSQSV